MTETADESEIRSRPCPDCILCGLSGNRCHENLRDRLFGAWGSWSQKKCSNRDCGLVWLDPMPLTEDLGKAYRNYYTHASPAAAGRPGLARRVYRTMKRAYQANRYQYHQGRLPLWQRILAWLMYLLPISRGQADAEVRFLQNVPQGRLLDVGCGSGEWLLSMRSLGWRVEGLDFDESAVAVARQHGLEVRLGAVEQQEFPNDSFDAITLAHVIEHVPDPVGTLAECARILKPGGQLVVATPNSSSLGHRFFQQDWRGLEPPRHLHLFSPQSMRRTLGLAGFQKVTIRPQIARTVISESFFLWRGATGGSALTGRSWSGWLFTRIFNGLELCLVKFNPAVADCMSAIAVK
jgi:2-polyprenyl-3-methyl-5-hydroxy-6-metoxy-1,4-benzoquinol methylase